MRKLSARRLEVLQWMSQGKSNEETAMILGIATLTVKNHASAILRNLGATNRTHAVAIALRTGLIT